MVVHYFEKLTQIYVYFNCLNALKVYLFFGFAKYFPVFCLFTSEFRFPDVQFGNDEIWNCQLNSQQQKKTT